MSDIRGDLDDTTERLLIEVGDLEHRVESLEADRAEVLAMLWKHGDDDSREWIKRKFAQFAASRIVIGA